MAPVAVGLAVGAAHGPEDHSTDTVLGEDGHASPDTEVIEEPLARNYNEFSSELEREFFNLLLSCVLGLLKSHF